MFRPKTKHNFLCRKEKWKPFDNVTTRIFRKKIEKNSYTKFHSHLLGAQLLM